MQKIRNRLRAGDGKRQPRNLTEIKSHGVIPNGLIAEGVSFAMHVVSRH